MKNIIATIFVISCLLTTTISVNAFDITHDEAPVNISGPAIIKADLYVDDDADPDWYDEKHVKKIQTAVDRAESGDTIFVISGTYNEHIKIEKVQPLTLIGQNKETTIIDGSIVIGSFIHGQIRNVNVKKFTIKIISPTNGGIIVGASDCTISDINFENHCYDGGGYTPYTACIGLVGIPYFPLPPYTIKCENNIIRDNTLVDLNPNDDFMIVGFDLFDADFNTIYRNEINVDFGIWFEDGVDGANNNKVIANTITQNQDVGIGIMPKCDNNLFYYNNFIDNGIGSVFDFDNAYDDSPNNWHINIDDTGIGNYWSDYEEKYPNAKDENNDGKWDTPYNIDGAGCNKDEYPLMEPVDIYNVEI